MSADLKKRNPFEFLRGAARESDADGTGKPPTNRGEPPGLTFSDYFHGHRGM